MDSAVDRLFALTLPSLLCAFALSAARKKGTDGEREVYLSGEDLALLRLVADLRHIAGAGERVLVHEAELLQLALIEVLLVVHELLEHELLQDSCQAT